MDTKNAREISIALQDYLNCFDYPEEDLVHEIASWHPTLQQNFTRLCIAWLKRISDPDFRPVDDRNKASARFARSIREEVLKAYLPVI